MDKVKLENGKDGADGKDGAPGVDGKDGENGLNGKDGADGLNGKDGAAGSPGEPGRAGEKGQDGTSVSIDDLLPLFVVRMKDWELEFERRAQDTLQRAVERLPRPKNGDPGKDGLSLEDFDAVVKDDGRTVVLSMKSRETVFTKELRLSIPVPRGVYKAGTYEKDDVVTWGGSWWIALQDTAEAPGGESKHWRLSIKRGRDGRDSTGD